MLRRYSVGQQSGAPVSTTPPTDAPVSSVSPPASPTWSRLRRSSEGQNSSSSVSRAVRLTPLRNAAASVFQTTRSALVADSGSTPPRDSASPVPSAIMQESGDETLGGVTAPPGPPHRLRLVPFLDMTRSLLFVPTELELRENGHAVQIGRFSERRRTDGESGEASDAAATPAVEITTETQPVPQALADDQAQIAARTSAATVNRQQTRVTFKSKVVSRLHAEIWCEAGGTIYIRDTKSSSGTFLNHLRLAPAGALSRPFALKDGDVLQFGIDYQGGVQELYRCIKLRVEIDRETRLQPTAYGSNMLRQLQTAQPEAQPAASSATPSRASGAELTECCICLFKIKVCQALFIAPCSHIFHYKCIRPLLTLHHPGFSCPLCRTFVNLDEDVEVDDGDDEDDNLPLAEMRNPNAATSPDADMDTSGSLGEMHSAPNSPLQVQEALPAQNTHTQLDAIVEQDSPALAPSAGQAVPSIGNDAMESVQTPFGIVQRPRPVA